MKAFSTAVLLAALAAFPLAAQEQQHEEKPAHSEVKPAPKAHPTDARPEGNAGRQQEARPAQPAKEARPQNPPAQQQHQAEQQHRAPEKGAQDQQKAQQHQAQQQQKPAQQPQKNQQKAQQKDADRQRQTQQQPNAQQHRAQTEQHNHPAPAQRAQNSPAPRNTGNSRRIPDDRFRSSFGHDHHFRVSRPEVVSGRSRFQYSGYWFEFVDPWPAAWSYDDDCYIDYEDDEYWLYDPVHPGMRIEINVVM